MAALPRNYPFYNWVPKPLGIIFLLFLFVPILTVGSVYTANIGEMMSGLGILSEHIQFVSFATSVGMAAFGPFFYNLVCIRRQKMMSLVGLSVMCILSYVCAITDSVILLAICSLVMGFLRIVLMMCNLFTLIKYALGMEATTRITPGTEPTTEEEWEEMDMSKVLSQPIVYFFFMLLGQAGTIITAWCAYQFEWQYTYYCMMGMILVSLVIIMVTMPFHRYPGKRFPITWSKFGNMSVFCVAGCSIAYVFVYGKTLDWFSSPEIVAATVLAVVSTLLFVWLDWKRYNPYFMLSIFKLKTIRVALLLFFFLMVFNSSSMFVNVFTSVGMKIDNWQSATLGNWTLVGYFIGAVIALILGKKGIHLKWLFAIGFMFIGFSALFMYFEVQTMGMYERMKWPIIIRCTGMMIIYSLAAAYANQRMPFKYMSTWVCIMLVVRMVVGPAAGSSLYANVMQERQQYYVTRYAQGFDNMNPEISQTYQMTVRGMRYQGKTEADAETMAAMSTKGKVQVQATLSAVKEMAGWTFWGCLLCSVIILIVPWRKRDVSKDTKDELCRLEGW